MTDDNAGMRLVVDGRVIDETLSYHLVTLSNKLSLTVSRRVLSEHGLTLREWRIMLSLLVFGPSIARRISEIAAIDPAHVSRTVRLLERRGVVALRSNKDDRRQIIIRLTDHGDARTREILPRTLSISDAFRELYSADEYRQLIRLLARANDFADRLLESDSLPVPSGKAGD